MDPFVYQYAAGGLVFGAGMVYAARQGFVGLSGAGLRNGGVMLGGLALFLAVQGYLQYAPMDEAAPVAHVPAAGGAQAAPGTRGHPIDYAVIGVYLVAILAIGTASTASRRTSRRGCGGSCGAVIEPGTPEQ